jgi:hypothetical protein
MRRGLVGLLAAAGLLAGAAGVSTAQTPATTITAASAGGKATPVHTLSQAGHYLVNGARIRMAGIVTAASPAGAAEPSAAPRTGVHVAAVGGDYLGTGVRIRAAANGSSTGKGLGALRTQVRTVSAAPTPSLATTALIAGHSVG